METDYLIVGAGAAGCILAERLSRDPRRRVLLVEAGPRDRHPLLHMPKGLGRIAGDPTYTWAFPVEAEGAFPGEIWPRGRTLGGSTATNAFIYNRGRPEDYDALEAAGCTGWNWETIAPSFVDLEDHPLGAADTRGCGGPLHLSLPRPGNPLHAALIRAGAELGLATPEDINAPERFTDGAIGLLPRTIHHGRRWSAARAFLDLAAGRPNLEVWTDALVDRVLFEGRRASGVRLTGPRAGDVRVNAEVILSAGAISSPAVLQRSGLGPARSLAAVGVAPLADLPAVGAGLVEHRNGYFQFRLRDPRLSQNRDLAGWRLFAHTLRYYASRRGIMGDSPCEVGGFLRAAPESERIDTQLLFMPISMGPVAPGSSRIRVDRDPGLTAILYPLRPQSRGKIVLRSADPDVLPQITPHYLQAEADRTIAVAATRLLRRLMTRTSLGALVASEIGPMAAAQDDEEIVEAWLRFGGPGCHAAGTCRMGSDLGSVVDPSLRVRGVQGLRVVDNSVFPFIVAGNTTAPVMACALRAASLIEQESKLQMAA